MWIDTCALAPWKSLHPTPYTLHPTPYTLTPNAGVWIDTCVHARSHRAFILTLLFAIVCAVQGYLAHKKTPPPRTLR